MTLRPKTPQEIEHMREGGKILSSILEQAQRFVTEGVSLKDIDSYIQGLINKSGAKPSFLGFQGFPAASCLSLNSVVVHGIPNEYRLQGGDVLGVDVGLLWEGYHTDAAFTMPIGTVSQSVRQLLQVTQQALHHGIEAAVAGNYVRDIGKEIENYINSQGQFGIIRDLTGHGIGQRLQELPEIPNYAGRDKILLVDGMTLAIEPMVSLGTWQVDINDDNWTVQTRDGSPAAHFETTVVVHENDPEVLVPFPLAYTC